MDYLVIGAGPAGLQLGYFLAGAGRDYLILEAGPGPGTFFRTYPRHRQLISINQRYTGRSDPERNLRVDWNSLLSHEPELLFPRFTGRYFPHADEMVEYLDTFATATGLNVRYNARVTEIARRGDFQVTDQTGTTYFAKRLIVATGVGELPYLPPIPGIEHADQYPTVSVNPEHFANRRVLIIGRGNSAVETADNLVEAAAVVHLAGPRSIRPVRPARYAFLDGTVERIERDAAGYLVSIDLAGSDGTATAAVTQVRYDRVIACTGFRFDDSIFAPECRPAKILNERFPAQTSAWESVNVPGLHFAGTLMQVRDFQHATSGYIHGFRYGVRVLHRILEARYHGVPWPSTSVDMDLDAMTRTIIGRVSRTSALWQQFGFLSDVLAVDGGDARYYEEVPMDLVREGQPTGASDRFVVTLEHDEGDDGGLLHPVIRHLRDDVLVATHHIAEDLEHEWDSPAHTGPLLAFLRAELRLPVTT